MGVDALDGDLPDLAGGGVSVVNGFLDAVADDVQGVEDFAAECVGNIGEAAPTFMPLLRLRILRT